MKSTYKIKIEYPRKCPKCPRIVYSSNDEDKHYKKHHSK